MYPMQYVRYIYTQTAFVVYLKFKFTGPLVFLLTKSSDFIPRMKLEILKEGKPVFLLEASDLGPEVFFI